MWKEDGARCPSIIRQLDDVGLYAPVRDVSDKAMVTNVTGVDNMRFRHWETARVNSKRGRAGGEGSWLRLEGNCSERRAGKYGTPDNDPWKP